MLCPFGSGKTTNTMVEDADELELEQGFAEGQI